MARPVARLMSTIAAASLAVSLAMGSVAQARAEDGTEPTPAPSSPAVTSETAGEPTTPPSPAGEPSEPVPASDTSDLGTDAGPSGIDLPAIAPGISPGERAARVDRITMAADEEPEPEPAESIYGWVWDSYSYDMVPGVEVQAWRNTQPDRELAATTTTDGDGFYAFIDLPAGDYVLQFYRAGFFSRWLGDPDTVGHNATVFTVTADGEPPEASTELDPEGWIRGTVTNSKNAPMAGQTVLLFFWSEDLEDWYPYGDLETDLDGRFVITRLQPGNWIVDDSGLTSGSRLKVEGGYVSLLSYWGSASGGLVSPWITGAPWTGSQQKAQPGYGSWKNTSLSYQWLRDGTAIPKAAASTYTPGTVDIDKQLQVRVTARQGYNTFTVISPTTWPIMRAAVPTISGAVAAGSRVTALPGQWQDGTTLTYQWYANGRAFSGANTDPTIVLTSSQKGKRISVKVTGRLGEFDPVSRTSATTGKVATAGMPAISGTRVVGATLKAKPGTWTRKTKFSYQWLRDGAAIPRATKTSYKLTSADAGKLVTVRVIGKLSGYATVSKYSTTTVKVMAAGTPSISGAAGTGVTLTARTGTWSPGTTFTYQWYADGRAFTGANTDPTVVLTSSQRGRKISVKVTGRLDGHATISKTSKATAKVLSVGTVTTSGTMVVGSTLTARPGTWTKKTKLSYQWLRDGAAISKATKSTYRLTSADADHKITVRVTGKLSGHATVSKASVTALNVLAVGTPSISGTAVVGFILTAIPGSWTADTTFSYQWYADGQPITGATGVTHELISDQLDKRITVAVTGSKAEYPTVTRTSPATAKVLAAG